MYKDLVNNKINYSLELPKTFVPKPTKEDYENQFIERYFVQRVNDVNGFIFEVNSVEFDNLENNPYWKKEKMRWRISGPLDPVYQNGNLIDIGVKNSNNGSLSIISKKLKNINLYISTPLQFYK